MSIHAALTHRTSYSYDKPVSLGPQVIRLRPAPHARTPILSYSLKVEPANHFINWQQDPQGNFQARVVFPEKVREFSVTVDLVADMATINPFDFFLEPDAERFPFSYDDVLSEELAPFRKTMPAGSKLRALLDGLPRTEMRTVDFLIHLNGEILRRTAYIVRMEPGIWDPERTLGEGRGSCRDSAWLMVQALRHLGLAARFCSGYLIQLVADQKPVEGPEGPTSDFTDLHAWAEVYLPGAGWVGLDATSGLMTGEGHIPLAATPEPQSAAPISGLVEPAETEFGFEMEVRRVANAPRVTKPYTPAQWAGIRAMGRRVDEALAPVRLTMGGEPTFVATTDREAAEWNTDALGPTKPASRRLLRRLGALWAPACHPHRPGQAVSRASRCPLRLSCHWRTTACRSGSTRACFAGDVDTEQRDRRERAAFARDLSQSLRLDPARVIRAHEDVHYYALARGSLPANCHRRKQQARRPAGSRARFARWFRATSPLLVGSVLPLRRRGEGWQNLRLAVSRRHPVPDAGRRTHGPAPAAQRPALGRPQDAGDGRRGRGGPLREAPAAAGSRRGGPAPRAAAESRRRSGPHRALRRAARGQAARLSAAAHRGRRLARPRRGDRGVGGGGPA
jgi:transglutaminase-like putative cysteine protease